MENTENRAEEDSKETEVPMTLIRSIGRRTTDVSQCGNFHLMNKVLERLAMTGSSQEVLQEMLKVCGVNNGSADSTIGISVLLMCFNSLTFIKGWDQNHRDLKGKIDEVRQLVKSSDVLVTLECFEGYCRLRRRKILKLGNSHKILKRACACAGQSGSSVATALILHYTGLLYWIWEEVLPCEATQQKALKCFEESADLMNNLIENGGSYMQNMRLRNLLFLIKVAMHVPWSYKMDEVKKYLTKHKFTEDHECINIQSMLELAYEYAWDIQMQEKSYYRSHFGDQIIHAEVFLLAKKILAGFIDPDTAGKQLQEKRCQYEHFIKVHTNHKINCIKFFRELFDHVDKMCQLWNKGFISDTDMGITCPKEIPIKDTESDSRIESSLTDISDISDISSNSSGGGSSPESDINN